jgi:hypothetical protein
VHLTSAHGAEPNAIIVIINENPTVPLDRRVSGSEADASGSWDADVTASSGDFLEISQEYASTRSTAITVQVP